MIDVWILTVVCLVVLMALATVRLVLGPTAPDRVIAARYGEHSRHCVNDHPRGRIQ